MVILPAASSHLATDTEESYERLDSVSIPTNTQPRSLGRTLKLYLVDGSPTGVITAELGNWSGKVLVASRSALPDLVKRKEAGQTGVYLLTGPDPTSLGRTLVYVGESDTVKRRLVAHDSDEAKQFFDRICIIVSKDENLTKAHGRYLESRILELIRKAARVHPVNATEPEFGGLPEAEIADMEGFLSEVEVLLPVLGFDLLRSGIDTDVGPQAPTDVGPTFRFTEAGTSARAKEAGGEFVVLAGSKARVKEVKSCPEGARALRRQLVEDGALKKEPEGKLYHFVRDVPFGSPSGAASAVYGGSVSGRIYWKVEGSDLNYGEWRDQRLATAREGSG